MRYLVKVNDQWEREYPVDPMKWLYRHDGGDAVAIDDSKPKVFYCATEKLRDDYKGQGKTAAMFYDLGKKLHESAPAFDPSADNPYWCATYSLACTERETCTDDCCYRPKEA